MKKLSSQVHEERCLSDPILHVEHAKKQLFTRKVQTSSISRCRAIRRIIDREQKREAEEQKLWRLADTFLSFLHNRS